MSTIKYSDTNAGKDEMKWFDNFLESKCKIPEKPNRKKINKTKKVIIQQFCGSCTNGWWCMGCGTSSKRQALEKNVTNKDLIEDILCIQMECGVCLVPCFICNKTGSINCTEKGISIVKSVWKDYIAYYK